MRIEEMMVASAFKQSMQVPHDVSKECQRRGMSSLEIQQEMQKFEIELQRLLYEPCENGGECDELMEESSEGDTDERQRLKARINALREA